MNAVEERYPDKHVVVTAGRYGAVKQEQCADTCGRAGAQVRRCLEEGTRNVGGRRMISVAAQCHIRYLRRHYFFPATYRHVFNRQVLKRCDWCVQPELIFYMHCDFGDVNEYTG